MLKRLGLVVFVVAATMNSACADTIARPKIVEGHAGLSIHCCPVNAATRT
ncbi:hypothetical protein [Mesorhizobium sp. CA12]|nr:hypothetical protein [Mesorhizobium sp. CA12]MBZ9860165.1 hypothetical protein [Mesorhizobium sp. CA12]